MLTSWLNTQERWELYRFDPEMHNRMIETENWQIVLGHGLDFYDPPEPGQRTRRARGCKIIYIPRDAAA